MSKKTTQEKLEELIKEADEVFSDLSMRKKSKSLYNKALRIAEKEMKNVEAEYIQGKMDLIDGRWEDAINHFDEVLESNPEFFKAWCYKGFSLATLTRYQEAIECYDKALEINARYAFVWSYKGYSLYEMHRYRESVECYDKALEINARYAFVWYKKGNSLRKIGRYLEAIECYDKALEIDSENVDVWINKGNSLYEMHRYQEAIECYDKALEIDSENEIIKDNRNLALMFLGRFGEAQREREKLYSKKKKEISESKIPRKEKKEKILEIDAKREVINALRDKYVEILDAKKAYENRLSASLEPRDDPLSDSFFLVLRRWNSYTPIMHTTIESNLGGGYFLYWKGKGIIIDPGFDFVDNFFNNGLVMHDIDAIIITHAHVDHCNDFESLLTLIFEYNENNKEKKKVDVFMNLGAMKKFLGWIPIDEEKNPLINRIYPLEKGVSYDLRGYNLRIKATKAIHNEILSKTYSVGLIFELYGEGNYTKNHPFEIGYTSDTRHDEDIEEQYKGVDIIVPHLGSIDENDFKLEEEKRHQNHLMLNGVISTIYRSNAELAIISEFGEELEEHRMSIVGALNRVFQENGMARCLTGDIGLTVSVPDLKVKCHYCKRYVSVDGILEGIDPESKDKKWVIHYCKGCKKTYEYLGRKQLDQVSNL
jgi:tetratricopeptide (TPR) repeat protein/ribonuclease BN (tRNA processing enzyme)